MEGETVSSTSSVAAGTVTTGAVVAGAATTGAVTAGAVTAGAVTTGAVTTGTVTTGTVTTGTVTGKGSTAGDNSVTGDKHSDRREDRGGQVANIQDVFSTSSYTQRAGGHSAK